MEKNLYSEHNKNQEFFLDLQNKMLTKQAFKRGSIAPE